MEETQSYAAQVAMIAIERSTEVPDVPRTTRGGSDRHRRHILTRSHGIHGGRGVRWFEDRQGLSVIRALVVNRFGTRASRDQKHKPNDSTNHEKDGTDANESDDHDGCTDHHRRFFCLFLGQFIRAAVARVRIGTAAGKAWGTARSVWRIGEIRTAWLGR